ncbi:hypothetical protein QRQ56_31090 [Bradyrhizobium sp. U531]
MSQQRRRVKQTRSLEERMAEQATTLREQANGLTAGAERDSLLRRAKIVESGAHISDWLRLPSLQPPK